MAKASTTVYMLRRSLPYPPDFVLANSRAAPPVGIKAAPAATIARVTAWTSETVEFVDPPGVVTAAGRVVAGAEVATAGTDDGASVDGADLGVVGVDVSTSCCALTEGWCTPIQIPKPPPRRIMAQPTRNWTIKR
jgi:hypothetical protein